MTEDDNSALDIVLTKPVSPLFHLHEEWKFTQKGRYLFGWGRGLGRWDTAETSQEPKDSFPSTSLPRQPMRSRNWHRLVTGESRT